MRLDGVIRVRGDLRARSKRCWLFRLETQRVLADRVVNIRVCFFIIRLFLGLTYENRRRRLVLGLYELRLRPAGQRCNALVEVLCPKGVLLELCSSISGILVLLLHRVSVASRDRLSKLVVDAVNRVFKGFHLIVVGIDHGLDVALARGLALDEGPRGRVILEAINDARVWLRDVSARLAWLWLDGFCRCSWLSNRVADEGIPLARPSNCLVQGLLHLVFAFFILSNGRNWAALDGLYLGHGDGIWRQILCLWGHLLLLDTCDWLLHLSLRYLLRLNLSWHLPR